MCWVCSCSYKRALAKTKQSDPARHSRYPSPACRKDKGNLINPSLKKITGYHDFANLDGFSQAEVITAVCQPLHCAQFEFIEGRGGKG